MAANAQRPAPWWNDIGCCPACGEAVAGLARLPHGRCGGCGARWTRDGNITIWEGSGTPGDRFIPAAWHAGTRLKGLARVFFLARRAAWNVGKAIGFPLRFVVQMRLESFRRRSLVDKGLAEHWQGHYFKGLNLPHDALLFEFSYRTVEKLGFAGLLGYRVAIQDVRRHAWWGEYPHAWFQAAPFTRPRLALADGLADAAFTDGAIFDLERDNLETLFSEYLRILKPGGYLLVWAGNSLSRTRARSERQWHGRIHSLEDVQRAARAAGLTEMDATFEGYAPPFFAAAISMVRAAVTPWRFKTYDCDSWLASWQQPQRRAYWLLRLVKTSPGAAQATA